MKGASGQTEAETKRETRLGRESGDGYKQPRGARLVKNQFDLLNPAGMADLSFSNKYRLVRVTKLLIFLIIRVSCSYNQEDDIFLFATKSRSQPISTVGYFENINRRENIETTGYSEMLKENQKEEAKSIRGFELHVNLLRLFILSYLRIHYTQNNVQYETTQILRRRYQQVLLYKVQTSVRTDI